MPVTVARRTPGVYVTELTSFPPSVVDVQTAVPAFIGYTQTAMASGKPVYNQAIPINSLADYVAIFGVGYEPVYTIAEATPKEITDNKYDFKVWDPDINPQAFKYYTLTQTSQSQFNLYNSMRLFYANGGAFCYVVSVGDYTQGATIKEADLEAGLAVAKEQVGPTMLVVPDAVLLPNNGNPDKPWESGDFAKLAKAMLLQCHDLQDRVAVLDVYGSQYTTRENMTDIITRFREDVGSEYLNYGMAYFPFVHSAVVPIDEYDYRNFTPIETLKEILTWQNKALYDGKRQILVQADIDSMSSSDDDKSASKLNQNLTNALPLLLDIERIIWTKNDILPPSGAMAGVFTANDANRGVWNAPANITLASVLRVTYKMNDNEQGDLNVPVNGKAVDALRQFVGRGTVVWGARTLDGNSNDYRYIPVRRTLIYIEQSVKNALNQFVFAPNDGNTWVTVVSMVSSFLQSVWSRGGLMGATAKEAYTVQCGLGSTMTAMDILQGYMVVQVTLQMIRPAEFIELTFKQKMDGIS